MSFWTILAGVVGCLIVVAAILRKVRTRMSESLPALSPWS
jgi:hypothetical protein